MPTGVNSSPSPTQYVTVGSDQWDYISFKLFGTEYYSDKLADANPQYVNVWVFDANIVLNVPVITPVKNVPVPPWARILVSA